MTMNIYRNGQRVRVSVAFTVNDVATDPSTVTLKVQAPDGTVDTYTYGASQVTKSSTGNYYKDVDVDQVGTWDFRFEGTGTCVAVEEQSFRVKTRFPV
jgi:uncharacterized protein YfaS (alpha-2-macroglobulin family)